MWKDELLDSSSEWVDRLSTALSRVDVAPTKPVIVAIINSLAANLDTPGALLHIQNWIIDTENGITGGEAGELSRALDTILGLTI
jgi:L-cysteine:1D-myo-inositol 2-amino-2-deoxy-alpha-D-glucopyranoside ligase